MSRDIENHNFQDLNNNIDGFHYKQTFYDTRDQYSPFIIKRSITMNNSIQAKHPLSNCNTSQNYKMYTPSPNVKERFSDRYIPCKNGLNLLAQFELGKSYNNQNNENKTSINIEPNPYNIESFSDQQSLNLNSNSVSVTSNNSVINSSNNNAVSNFLSPPKEDLNINANYDELLKTSIFGDETYTSLIKNTTLSTATKILKTKIFRFKTEYKKKSNYTSNDLNEIAYNFSVQNLENTQRKINKNPFKILDAPNLMDDFYLNLIDWSSQNDLSVGLLDSVYIWSANKSRVTKLCEYGNEIYASSVIWNPCGSHVAVGTSEGTLDIWDVQMQKKVRSLEGHSERIGVISWAKNTISTGSKDYNILNRDLRASEPFYDKLCSHRQEVCGLKWNFDESQLASGGNDNKLIIWSKLSNQPLMKFSNHDAAVKAIAWSPYQNNLLASGGGTNDRCIRFWNTSILQQIHYVDTGSQVCNLIYSKSNNEIVSTHGYSLNQIIIWKYPTMQKISTLTGHTYRVLYLAISPDGQNIVTGAGDESLRFWNVFPPIKNNNLDKPNGSTLFPSNTDIR